MNQSAYEIGPINVYMIYDNCPPGAIPWNLQYIPNPNSTNKLNTMFHDPAGGIRYACFGNAVQKWLQDPAVQTALHVNGTWQISAFNYRAMTFSSYDAYGSMLVEKYPILIYNGDVDTVCPWNQNQDWVEAIVQNNMSKPLVVPPSPWFLPSNPTVSAGNRRTYRVSATHNFTFLTIHGAGHEVPTYQPERAFYIFDRFIKGKPI